MQGIEARELRQGDEIIGIGTVTKVLPRVEGEVRVLVEGTGVVGYDPDAWLRIERVS